VGGAAVVRQESWKKGSVPREKSGTGEPSLRENRPTGRKRIAAFRTFFHDFEKRGRPRCLCWCGAEGQERRGVLGCRELVEGERLITGGNSEALEGEEVSFEGDRWSG